MTDSQLSHFDDSGNARMVDVTEKAATVRRAIAAARITMQPETLRMIREGQHAKGDVLGVARLAAIMAGKQTPQLIPLCHAIPIESIEVDFAELDPATLECLVTVKTSAKTGVEMEALTAASIACLTVYDMCKSVDRAMRMEAVRLVEKTGGKSDYRQAEPG